MSTRVELQDGVAIVTIERPQARNAIDGATAAALAEAMDRIDSERAIRVGVITGAGGNFCAGMDLKAFLRGEVVRIPGKGFAGIAQAQVSKPMIAAVEGYALAGGFEIALACDLIVAAEDAKFGLPEVRRALVANAGGLIRLPRQLPMKIAAELVLTGETYPAALLAQHGLINRLVPSGTALQAALEYAHKIAANGPLAVAVSKQVLRDSPDWSASDMFERQFELTAPVFKSLDAREGAAAFAEKRAPQWRGE
jgi:enoyl-CoA hydratase/carnithine racemase